MSSTASGYGDLREVRRRLNIPDTVDSSDAKIEDFINESDNYVNIQINLHATTPISNPDSELISLSSSLAAALFNYWQTPVKDRNLEGIKAWKLHIQEHIMAAYGRYSAAGLGGADLFGKTVGFKP